MTAQTDAIISDLFAELRTSQRYQPFIQRAEQEGYPQLAKMLRALSTCEKYREELFRKGIPNHVEDTSDFYVCPHCGLVYEAEAPDVCPVDETPGNKFTLVH